MSSTPLRLTKSRKRMLNDPTKNKIVCERCRQPFICNPTNIAGCDCSKIKLSEQETTYISKQYSDCICNSCLLLLRDEFLSQ